MRGFLIATMFLTRLPMPRVAADAAAFAASMRWFPAVGLLVGLLVAAAGWAGAQIDPWTGALLALLGWVGVTGALHLDGLGDLADAGGAAHGEKTRLLAVLADPHVGSFAVVAIGSQLIAKLVLLHAAITGGAWVAIALIPFAARIGPLVWRRLTPLHDGLAARFTTAIRPRDLIGWGAMLAGACVAAPGLIAAPPAILWWHRRMRATLGGINGDGHGAGIEIVETVLLLATAIAGRLA